MTRQRIGTGTAGGHSWPSARGARAAVAAPAIKRAGRDWSPKFSSVCTTRLATAKTVPSSPTMLPFCNTARSLVAGIQLGRDAIDRGVFRDFIPISGVGSTFSIAVWNFPTCDRAGHTLCPLACPPKLGLSLLQSTKSEPVHEIKYTSVGTRSRARSKTIEANTPRNNFGHWRVCSGTSCGELVFQRRARTRHDA